MMYGASLIYGFEYVGDLDGIYAEEHIYLVDFVDSGGEDEDNFWDTIFGKFVSIGPEIGNAKKVYQPSSAHKMKAVLFSRKIRKLSIVSTGLANHDSIVTKPLFITSRQMFFNNRSEYLTYANGINVDVKNDDSIPIRSISI